MSATEVQSAELLAVESAAPPARRGSTWIISPTADLALLIVTPLAIVPLTLLVARSYWSVERISLCVVAFASIGHHVPGFLRAYGDRELFARFRWRFLLAPPVVVLAAWLVAQTRLNGLVLLLLLWSTWHVLMQTYGMLRIYDLKRGLGMAPRARRDFWFCIALFGCGLAFSDVRLLTIGEIAWRVGLPMLTPLAVVVLRVTVGVVAVVALGAYLLGLARDYRGGQIVWTKLLLLLTTGGLYWLCGINGIPVLLGVAMFEVFHAIQYDALVWAYDRRLGAKVGNRLGPLRAIFERREWFAAIYVAAIAGYGVFRLLAENVANPRVQTILFAVLTASTLLHFYFDGFIWKVGAARRGVPAEASLANRREFPHGIKCLALGLVVAGLLLLEYRGGPADGHEFDWLSNAASWAPGLPDVQSRLAREDIRRGDVPAALVAARRAASLQPNSADAQADVGAVLLRSEDYAEAVVALGTAHRLQPGSWQHAYDLGVAQTKLAHWTEAECAFRDADRSSPHNPQIESGWAQALFQLGNQAYVAGDLIAAGTDYRHSITLSPGLAEAQINLGAVLFAQHDWSAASASYRHALELAPNNAQVHYNLGLLLLLQSDLPAARQEVVRAAELGQMPSPEVATKLGL